MLLRKCRKLGMNSISQSRKIRRIVRTSGKAPSKSFEPPQPLKVFCEDLSSLGGVGKVQRGLSERSISRDSRDSTQSRECGKQGETQSNHFLEALVLSAKPLFSVLVHKSQEAHLCPFAVPKAGLLFSQRPGGQQQQQQQQQQPQQPHLARDRFSCRSDRSLSRDSNAQPPPVQVALCGGALGEEF